MDAERFDVALATLASVFEETDPDVLVSALQDADGDVERATDAILSRSPRPDRPAKRRKPDASGLAGWLRSSDKDDPSRTSTTNPSPAALTRLRLKSPLGTAPSNRPTPTKSINDVLRATPVDRPPAPPANASLPPLTLTSPQMVATHLPCCSLLLDVLPKELASQLYLQLLDDSDGKPVEGGTATPWDHNSWYLNDRLVESSHATTFFVSSGSGEQDRSYDECAQYWYQGRKSTLEARQFLLPMEEAKTHIEPIVNAMMANDPSMLARAGRPSVPVERFPLEHDGKWRANVAAANCYRNSKETVGFHADQVSCPASTTATVADDPPPADLPRSISDHREPLARCDAGLSSSSHPISLVGRSPKNVQHPGSAQLAPHHASSVSRALQAHGTAAADDRRLSTVGKRRTNAYGADQRHLSLLSTGLSPGLRAKGCRQGWKGQRVGAEVPLRCPDGLACGPVRLAVSLTLLVRLMRLAIRKGKAAAAASAREATFGIASSSKETAETLRFFWHCQAGAQNEGQGCKFFRFLDIRAEGRGPCLGDRANAKAEVASGSDVKH